MRLRVARHTDRLAEVVTFYRDRLGLPELGRFDGHAGYDGVWAEHGLTFADPDGFRIVLAAQSWQTDLDHARWS